MAAPSSGSSWAARIEASWQAGPDTPWWLPWLLRPLSGVHSLLVNLRHRLYRAGLLSRERLPVPVIVVGNRIVGGAGKTPTTLALVHALTMAGWRPGIVSRGHGSPQRHSRPVRPDSSAAEVGDEPLLMQRRSQVPVWVGRDRVAAGRALCAAHPEVNVVVCDDGLQHLRLQRDIEIIVFDERGAGNGWLLPAGPLREPINTPSTAPHQTVLYTHGQPSTALTGGHAQRQLVGAVELAAWWQGAPATRQTLDALISATRQTHSTAPPTAAPAARMRCWACAGVGQPQRFFQGLQALGLTDFTPLPLPDHHDFATLPWPAEATDVVLTEKDAVKLPPARVQAERPQQRVWVVPLGLVLPEDWVADLLDTLARCSGKQTG